MTADLPETSWLIDHSPMQSVACFGMNIKVSDEQKAVVRHIVRPIQTHVVLTNDFCSFEREYEEYINGKKYEMRNSVWFLMQHHGLEQRQAKHRVLEKALKCEKDYTAARTAYENGHPNMCPKVARYIDAASFIASGAWYWQTFCSRHRYIYRPDNVSDHRTVNIPLSPGEVAPLNAGPAFESESTCNGLLAPVQNCLTITSGTEVGGSFTDVGRIDLLDEVGQHPPRFRASLRQLSVLVQTVLAPYDYLSSLPSKGIRDAAIDALDIWLDLPDSSLAPIRLIVKYLHSASLM